MALKSSFASVGLGVLLFVALFWAAPTWAACASATDIGDGWTISKPVEAGFDVNKLCALLGKISEGDENIHSVLVERRGNLIVELYKQGSDRPLYSLFSMDKSFGPKDRHDLRSVSKSVVGLLAGIAIDRGFIPTTSSRVLDFYPEFADLRSENRETITLEHLLTMTSGLEWDEVTRSYERLGNDRVHLFWYWSPDRYVLSKPVIAPAGTAFHYSGGNTTVIADILVRATKTPLREFAQETLFGPLGIQDWEWTGDVYGSPLAHAGLRLRPRDLLKIGKMVLADGVWNGRQIVSSAWVRRSLSPHIQASGGLNYGYQWWLGSVDWRGKPLKWSAAIGDGGQRLFLVPDLDLAVVFTAGAYRDEATANAIEKLLAELVASINE